VLVRDPSTEEELFARFKVPDGLPRFLRSNAIGPLLPLERVIVHFLPGLFPGIEIEARGFFRVTRDADFEVSDEADDLLEALQTELHRRRFGDVVRLEVWESMSEMMLAQLKEELGINDDQVYPVRGLIDMSQLTEIADLDRPELKFDRWAGVTRRPFTAPDARTLFLSLRRTDALVQIPYDSFASSAEAFVGRAARDPQDPRSRRPETARHD
jgi:polyphosphate kinase